MKPTHCAASILCVLILATSCKKKSDPEPAYFYASTQIKGVATTFKTTSNFSKFCILTGVCNTFYGDPSVIDKNALMIGFPLSVKAGVTYTNDSSWTQVLYTDKNGHQYFSHTGDSLRITITKWEGHGGTGEGTFSGKLRYYPDPPLTADSLYLKNGTFSAKIWYVIQ